MQTVTTKPKLLDQVRTLMRLKHLSLRTEEAYVGWIRRFTKRRLFCFAVSLPRSVGARISATRRRGASAPRSRARLK